VHENSANANHLSRRNDPSCAVAKHRSAKTAAWIKVIDGQAPEYHHRCRIRHVAAKASGRLVNAD
jgi:hypothetical protein